MKIIQIEDVEHIELEQFSKPVFILLDGLTQEDIEKFRALDTEVPNE